MEREQFTFYSSFGKAIRRIKKPADRCAAYEAVIDYALYGTLPDLDAIPESAAIVFEVIKPNLDASRRKAESGKKGGSSDNSKQGEAASKSEANLSKSKQNEASEDSDKQEEAASKNKDKDKNKNKNKIKDKCPLSPLPPSGEYTEEAWKRDLLSAAFANRSPRLISTVQTWLQYKREKRNTYQKSGLTMLVNKINRMVDEYGEEAVINVIEESMSHNYQGIVWDWLKKSKPSSAGSLENSYAMMEAWAND